MINLRVADLRAMHAQLKAAGCKMDEKIEEAEQGVFGCEERLRERLRTRTDGRPVQAARPGLGLTVRLSGAHDRSPPRPATITGRQGG